MNVCYLSLSVLWGAVAALQGGLRGVLAVDYVGLWPMLAA